MESVVLDRLMQCPVIEIVPARDRALPVAHAPLAGHQVFLFQVAHRIEQVWRGLAKGFARGLAEIRPVFKDQTVALGQWGRAIGAVFSNLAGGAAKLPSSKFFSFGQAAGQALGADAPG